jgi:hypothetical protein
MRFSAVLLVAALVSSASAGELIERVVAVVDGRALCLSDVRAVEALDGVGAPEALTRLVDETLIFHETFRLPQAALSADEERAVQDPDPARHRAHRRRSVIHKYVAFRFRPQVRIDDARLAPAERERLIGEEVDRRVAEWLRDLRAAATIRYNPLEPD